MQFSAQIPLKVLAGILLLLPLAIEGERILLNLPTMLDVHFDFAMKLAKDLVEADKNEVHILIMNTGKWRSEKIKGRMASEGAKLQLAGHGTGKEGHLTYEIFDDFGQFEDPHELVGNKWMKRGHDQNEKILHYEAFDVYKKFLESPEGKQIIERLKGKFDAALFDTWDFGAQFIFFLLGIHNVVAFNKISLLTYQMEYAGTRSHLPKDVPEVYSTEIGEAKRKDNPDEQEHFRQGHTNEMGRFEGIHKKMDEWFKPKYATSNWPGIREVYKKIKKVFEDSQPFMHFDLGGGKPANLEYFGGIHLANHMGKKEGHGKGADKKKSAKASANLVLMSLDFCEQMVNEENKKGFHRILEAFKAFRTDEFAHLHFQIDCGSEDMKNAVAGKEGGYGEFIKVEKVEKLEMESLLGETRLLISNCSSGPVLEAMAAGVPLVCVPFMVDQFYISEALKLMGKGRQQVAHTLDINKIMKNEQIEVDVEEEEGEEGEGSGSAHRHRHQAAGAKTRKMAPIPAIVQVLKNAMGKSYLNGAKKQQKYMHDAVPKAKQAFLDAFATGSADGSSSKARSGDKAN